MSPEEKLALIEKQTKQILKEIKELYLDKVEKNIDEEDGEVFWVKKGFIPNRDIDAGELLLNSVAKLYRDAKLPNRSEKYRKYSRMVAHIRLGFLPKSLTELLEELDVKDEDNRTDTTKHKRKEEVVTV